MIKKKGMQRMLVQVHTRNSEGQVFTEVTKGMKLKREREMTLVVQDRPMILEHDET